ncbi:hypothetical protein [Enterococcus sp. LJL51]|uniref:hypothetical protein n=1 Tax=Enterococcus sp. LJL51 TaxID=3416656 RepID=UPI003CEB7746
MIKNVQENIEARVIELGGKCHFDNKSMISNLENIVFSESYLFGDFEYYLQDDIYKKLKEGKNISYSDIPYPRIQYQTKLFTPFKHGTEDHREFGDLDKNVIRKVINEEFLEFIIIGETDSFPNFYFVCCADKDMKNPVVYSTDHESFFTEIEKAGRLEDFFAMLVSEKEYILRINKLSGSLQSEKD